jgi:acyl carrier protein
MNGRDIRQELRSYITENFLYARPDYVLSDEDDLLASGIIDSMGVTEVIAFLEDGFGLTVDDADITEENFGTVLAITTYAGGRLDQRRELRTA